MACLIAQPHIWLPRNTVSPIGFDGNQLLSNTVVGIVLYIAQGQVLASALWIMRIVGILYLSDEGSHQDSSLSAEASPNRKSMQCPAKETGPDGLVKETNSR